jgi:hypothetical protein
MRNSYGDGEDMPGPRIANFLWPNWYDVNQKGCNTGWSLANQDAEPLGIYESLIDAAAALSVAGMRGLTIQIRMVREAEPDVGLFASVRDQALFEFKSANYTKQLAIPCPKESIFIPGSNEIDSANVDVQSFITQVMAVLGDSYGSPWTTYVGGVRTRKRIGET